MVTAFLTEEILFLTEKLQSTLLSKDLTLLQKVYHYYARK